MAEEEYEEEYDEGYVIGLFGAKDPEGAKHDLSTILNESISLTDEERMRLKKIKRRRELKNKDEIRDWVASVLWRLDELVNADKALKTPSEKARTEIRELLERAHKLEYNDLDWVSYKLMRKLKLLSKEYLK